MGKLKGKSKGQFLIISAVVIGVMVISAASTIKEIQSEDFSHSSIPYDINSIKDEAEKVDPDSRNQRAAFKIAVSEVPGYESDAVAWDQGQDGTYDCFNVTLKSADTRLELKCID